MSKEHTQHELVTEEGWRWNYLLIDGIALPEAEKQLYQACDSPEHVNLFAGPVYGEISDVGPLLVRVTFEHPLVQRLIGEDFGVEWGYLLNSMLDLPALASWFRQFIRVSHPAGVDVFLRFAEPAVASVLFGEAGPFRRAGTPVEEVLLPDALKDDWRHIEVSRASGQAFAMSLTLSEPDIEALTKVDQRRLLRAMVAHLEQFFSDWASEAERGVQIARLSRLLDLARQANYVSERSLTQWTNVFGFSLPDQVPDDLPEPVQALLRVIPPEDDAESAARKAALLARETQRTNNENSGTEQIT